MQILTIEDLPGGKNINRPPEKHTSVTYKQAPKVILKAAETPPLFGE